jgi:hypothetical protein
VRLWSHHGEGVWYSSNVEDFADASSGVVVKAKRYLSRDQLVTRLLEIANAIDQDRDRR